MIFNSLEFLIFFPVVVCVYFLLPHIHRLKWLLVASIYFYTFSNFFNGLLLFISIFVNFFLAKMIVQREDKASRFYLILGVIFNLGFLSLFKYYNFFFSNINSLLDLKIPLHKLVLPIGISFYTFQALGYLIDVYRRNMKPANDMGIFALYIYFFPQLVAGPIERASHLINQFYEKKEFNYQRLREGALLILWGFFKKVVVADRLAIAVNQVYNNPLEYSGIPLLIATYFFAFQIFCDFSAYSDIAIGAARILGIDLMKNFNTPYIAKSIVEFWQRWHISLSTWIRDYLYIPLGGNKVSLGRWAFNILIVFLLSGLWHGANWTFLIWGVLHGIYMIVHRLIGPIRQNLSDVFKRMHLEIIFKGFCILLTFHIVLLGWIFFRANSVSEAFYILSHLWIGWNFKQTGLSLGLGINEFMIAILSLCFMGFIYAIYQRIKKPVHIWLLDRPFWMRWPAYYFILYTILIFGKFESNLEFIYFQF